MSELENSEFWKKKNKKKNLEIEKMNWPTEDVWRPSIESLHVFGLQQKR